MPWWREQQRGCHWLHFMQTGKDVAGWRPAWLCSTGRDCFMSDSKGWIFSGVIKFQCYWFSHRPLPQTENNYTRDSWNQMECGIKSWSYWTKHARETTPIATFKYTCRDLCVHLKQEESTLLNLTNHRLGSVRTHSLRLSLKPKSTEYAL